jgi:predicted O-linked N-acetylglucosamine transferase (SPINDLY family)
LHTFELLTEVLPGMLIQKTALTTGTADQLTADRCYVKAGLRHFFLENRDDMTVDIDPRLLFERAAKAAMAERWGEAGDLFRQVLSLRPDHESSRLNRGICLIRSGRDINGLGELRKLLVLAPGTLDGWRNLAAVALKTGRLTESGTWTARARTFEPTATDLLRLAARTAERRGDAAEASRTWGLVRLVEPEAPDAALTIASADVNAGRRAVILTPKSAIAWDALGVAFYRRARLEPAAQCFRTALSLAPELSAARMNLASTDLGLHRYRSATTAYRRELIGNPRAATAWQGLGTALVEIGRPIDALRALDRAEVLTPSSLSVATDRFATAHYVSEVADTVFPAWAVGLITRFAGTAELSTPMIRPTERLPHLAYLGDLSREQVARLAHPVMASHDPARLHVSFYTGSSEGRPAGALDPLPSERVVDLGAATPGQIADRLRADGVDIAIAVSGQLHPESLLALARRPAALQLAWGDVFDSTGVRAIDGLITDAHHVPDPTASGFVDRPVHLSTGAFFFAAPKDAPEPGPLPLSLRAGIGAGPVFASLNRLAKITDPVVALWSQILTRTPNSRLLLQARAFSDPVIAETTRARFAAHGISGDRIETIGPTDRAGMLALWRRADLGLDPFPWSGGLTTLEALWMGVPVITLPGARYCSRHSLAHLSRFGLARFVADTPEGYIDKAVAAVTNPADLAAARVELRSRMRADATTDPVRYAKALEELILQMWRARA